MVASQPALLAVAAEDLNTRVEAFEALLGGSESDLSFLFVEQPRLLLVDVDDVLREKVGGSCASTSR